MRAVRIDTSGLEPPEPMARALEALGALAADEYLVMAHRREPLPLYDLLPVLGFQYRARPGASTAFEVVVWRAGQPDPEPGA